MSSNAKQYKLILKCHTKGHVALLRSNRAGENLLLIDTTLGAESWKPEIQTESQVDAVRPFWATKLRLLGQLFAEVGIQAGDLATCTYLFLKAFLASYECLQIIECSNTFANPRGSVQVTDSWYFLNAWVFYIAKDGMPG